MKSPRPEKKARVASRSPSPVVDQPLGDQQVMGNAAVMDQLPQAANQDNPLLALAQGELAERPHNTPRESEHVKGGDVDGDGEDEVDMHETRFADDGQDLFTLGAGPCHALAIYTPGTVNMVAHLVNGTDAESIEQWSSQLQAIVTDVYAKNQLNRGDVNGDSFRGTRIHLTGGYEFTDSLEHFDENRFDEVVGFLTASFPGAEVSYHFNPANVKTTEALGDADGSVSLELAFDGEITVDVG